MYHHPQGDLRSKYPVQVSCQNLLALFQDSDINRKNGDFHGFPFENVYLGRKTHFLKEYLVSFNF